tara:strand:+ start:803 stop:949 length:147 start_codon:yes stop_codon:yes gene_type:complete
MKVGDLVRWVSCDVIGVITYIDGYLHQVRYTDGKIGHHYNWDIEVLNE